MQEKRIAVLGSTGSIGTQTLEVCEKHGFPVAALCANQNWKLLEQQARKFRPQAVCLVDEIAFRQAKLALADTPVRVLCGQEGMLELAALDSVDLVLNAVVGIAGLRATMTALAAGKTLALANKESLVTGGKLVMQAAQDHHVPILPVDSEHSAIFQCLEGHNCREEFHKIILTASGGPFFGKTRDQLKAVTVKEALSHPNWSMGAKITVDSATLMNKGLELIEAAWLFGKSAQDVDIVVHRESVVHSAIELCDGSVIAQLGVPDMKIPIQLALTYPRRLDCDVRRLKLTDYAKLTFFEPDYETFRCLWACKRAFQLGGLYPCIVNGANEQAVELFLKGKISFLQIGELVEASLGLPVSRGEYSLADVFSADTAARAFVLEHAGC